MTRTLITTLIALITTSGYVLGQKSNCEMKIILLKSGNIQELNSVETENSILTAAKLTNTVLVNDDEIKYFKIKKDTNCCIYSGPEFSTSHQFTLTKEAVSRISSLKIPLCCGIPIALYINGKEVYRALLWNVESSFGNKSITATLVRDTIIFINQLPTIPDNRNRSLVSKNNFVNCLIQK